MLTLKPRAQTMGMRLLDLPAVILSSNARTVDAPTQTSDLCAFYLEELGP